MSRFLAQFEGIFAPCAFAGGAGASVKTTIKMTKIKTCC